MTDPVGQAAVDRALDEENLVLVYQPIHDARSGAIVAAEALLRQRRETGEIREASIITSTAEETSDLFALDSWTMKTAFRDAARWQSGAGHAVRLNMNLSPREFEESDVRARLEPLVGECGIDPRNISLEITETSYIAHPDETRHVLRDLKQAGVALWLDDFGCGHSSLAHLQLFPVDGIKIPSAFVAKIESDRRSHTLTRALVNLARDLGMKVIAEGVERKAQLEILLEFGCDEIQGFLFSRPMLIGDFEQLVEETAKEPPK